MKKKEIICTNEELAKTTFDFAPCKVKLVGDTKTQKRIGGC